MQSRTLLKRVHTQQKRVLPWMNKCMEKRNLPTTAIGSVSEINGHQLKMRLADIQCRQIFVEEKERRSER